ncbi:RNA polymerase sigma factor (sigma-70 family) [Amycolatopsis echigonensis]|uniref:RNA polymerase sigma factor (Sigma-70 family) n=1 Tax=Amycolatopsis echigonensis TaxID=2576905 RepID=A0A2N3X000_9PSEU|nr:sigma-70 family RNA polymerase sigma factor [Amycolatopsis niigatensis]PKV99437.1 RNA polymerase sigma factor (sigma-70 family) [Amycolatopsis niigatensis]
MADVGELLRPLVPQVLGTLVRRYGQFEACEDAVQEALVAAVEQWSAGEVPDNPRAWLLTVATRRLTDLWRSESARRRREETVAVQDVALTAAVPGPEDEQPPEQDDTLTLLFLCCHPAITPSSQVALTLRAVGGLTTAEIARAFLVPEGTMARRITRAKETVAAAGSTFTPPSAEDWPARLQVVLHVLYLIFNEGYTATSGENLHRAELSEEAIRLTRAVHALLPDDGEVAGLLALMLLTDARRPARTGPDGTLTPLAEQDRRKWMVPLIVEGLELVNRVLGQGPVGPYQVQAAIAALHDQAAGADSTDWAQILELYGLLEELAPSPVTTLNRAIAVAMVHGPEKALALLATLEDDARLKQGHRLDAVRAHLLELAGDTASAREHYLRAAKRTSSIPERRYLQAKAAKLLPREG